jgi:hypothetical protein
MLAPGASRDRLERTLNAAYGDGLLSQSTFMYRIDLLLGDRLVDPAKLVGDLTVRGRRHGIRSLIALAVESARDRLRGPAVAEPPLLALDWSGAQEELLVGRHTDCDIVLEDPTVSRRHARLRFRDGNWVLQDLESKNGTRVNAVSVVRCRLHPGDHLTLGDLQLRVD